MGNALSLNDLTVWYLCYILKTAMSTMCIEKYFTVNSIQPTPFKLVRDDRLMFQRANTRYSSQTCRDAKLGPTSIPWQSDYTIPLIRRDWRWVLAPATTTKHPDLFHAQSKHLIPCSVLLCCREVTASTTTTKTITLRIPFHLKQLALGFLYMYLNLDFPVLKMPLLWTRGNRTPSLRPPVHSDYNPPAISQPRGNEARASIAWWCQLIRSHGSMTCRTVCLRG